jgi:toxin ParE1/3/4
VKLAVSRRADADIQQIADYTLAKWGEEQARRYVGGLWREMEALARSAAVGQDVDGLPVEIRRSTYESHFIVFVHDGETLLIARVLHRRMDMVRHLR